MVHMVGPGERYKDVDIEQCRHGHSSSAPYTSSLAIGRASAATANTGRPSSPATVAGCLNPRRASSDSALPRLLRLRSARARATASTSSSIVTVVRIRTSSHQHINLATAWLPDVVPSPRAERQRRRAEPTAKSPDHAVRSERPSLQLLCAIVSCRAGLARLHPTRGHSRPMLGYHPGLALGPRLFRNATDS